MNFNELYYQKSQKRETRIQWIMDECEQKQLYDDLGIIGEISPDAGSSVLFERDENNKTKECNVLQNYHQFNIETPATNTSVKIKRKHALNRFQRKRCRPTTKVIGNMYHAKIGKMDISSEPETASTHVHKKRALDSSVVGKLPDEVFLKIFRYCSSDTRVLCSHVCWRWYHMINDESLWRQISLARKAITIHEVQRLLKRNMQVLCLNCAIIKPNSSGELNTSTASFKEGFSASPRADPFSRTYHYPVHSLDFTNANISPNLLCLILMRCNNLQNLSLEGLTISHNVLGSLSACKQLQRLNLCLCHEMTTSGVIQLLTACTKILELNLGWTNLCQFDPGQIIENLPPSLTRLNISGFRDTLVDQHVISLVQHCPNLVELDVSDSNLITSNILEYIINGLFDTIHAINLSRCYSISPNCFLRLSRLPHLRYLDVFGVMDDGSISTLATALTRVRVCLRPFSAIARPSPSSLYGTKRQTVWGYYVV